MTGERIDLEEPLPDDLEAALGRPILHEALVPIVRPAATSSLDAPADRA